MASEYFAQMIADALEVLTNFSVPLYETDEYGRPSLHGTGFFVKAGDSHYLVSAAHVLDTAMKSGLFFYTSPGTTRKLTGSVCLSSGAVHRQLDMIDIGVLRLMEESVPPYPLVNKYAMALEYLRSEYLPRAGRSYVILGFPGTKSKVSRSDRTVLAAPYAYRCEPVPDDQYAAYGVAPETHVLLHLNLKVGYDPDGNHQHFPKPQGMSGAPIIVLYSDGPKDDARVFPVVAVGTTYRAKQKVLIGTDVRFVLEAIEHAG